MSKPQRLGCFELEFELLQALLLIPDDHRLLRVIQTRRGIEVIIEGPQLPEMCEGCLPTVSYPQYTTDGDGKTKFIGFGWDGRTHFEREKNVGS